MTDLSTLSNEQLNVKLAKRNGWKLVDGKWWHDDVGDGPPPDACKVWGREWIVRALARDVEKTDESPSAAIAHAMDRIETVARRLRHALMGKSWTCRNADADILEREVIPKLRRLL